MFSLVRDYCLQSDDEIKALLNFTIELARKLDALLLVGVLKTDVSSTIEAIAETLTMLEQKAGVEDPIKLLNGRIISADLY